jgi:hypothetical protein
VGRDRGEDGGHEAAREVWTFGEEPLPATLELAAILRRLAGHAQALEAAPADLDRLRGQLLEVEQELTAGAPGSERPRVGDAVDGDGRVYVDHGRDVWAFNAVFPAYTITVDGDDAHGEVTFPTVYEGPPGLVHGGVVGLFVDAVVQHHNCQVGQAGKTTRLEVRFRRPTPLLVPLSFTIRRQVEGDRILSSVTIGDEAGACAEAEMRAVVATRSALPPVSPRRAAP